MMHGHTYIKLSTTYNLIVCVLGVFTFFRILTQYSSNVPRTLSNNARFLFFSTYLKYVTDPVHWNPNFRKNVYVLPKHQCHFHILKNKIVNRHLINRPLYHTSTGRVAIQSFANLTFAPDADKYSFHLFAPLRPRE